MRPQERVMSFGIQKLFDDHCKVEPTQYLDLVWVGLKLVCNVNWKGHHVRDLGPVDTMDHEGRPWKLVLFFLFFFIFLRSN